MGFPNFSISDNLIRKGFWNTLWMGFPQTTGLSVSRLQNVVSALNNEKTRLTGMKPVNAIKQTLVKQREVLV